MLLRRTSGQASLGPAEGTCREHALQLYDSPEQLASTVGRFVATALSEGRGAVVIARPVHLEGIDADLTARNIDVASVREAGRYVALDADTTLAQIVGADGIDRAMLDEFLQTTILPLHGRFGGVSVCGEMAPLLWEGDMPLLALELEEIWNGFARDVGFPLLCTYPIRLFERTTGAGTFETMLAHHGQVFPGGAFDAMAADDAARRLLASLQQRALAFDAESERRRMNETQFRRLMALLPVGVCTCEAPSGAISYYNDKAAELWGHAPVIGDPAVRYCGALRLRHADGRPLPHDDSPMAAALRDGVEIRNHELTFERADGTSVAVFVNVDPMRDDAGRVTGAVSVFHDITEIRKTEQALSDQRQHLQTLLETLPVAVFLADDDDCRYIAGNRAASDLLRVPPGGNFSKTAPTEHAPGHFRILRDGREIPSEQLPMQRAAHGEIVAEEPMQVAFDDGTVTDLLVTAQPVLDPTGRPRGSVACMLDVTELRRAERALREASRRKDEFLAMLAHELRNPLAAIRHSLSVLRLAGGSPGFDAAPVYAVMERQLAQLVRLVDDLLELSRITRGTIELREEPVDLAMVIMNAIETCRPLIDARQHHIHVDLPPGVIVRGDAVRLSQIFGNLLNNAAHYTEPGGTITVTAARDGRDAVVSVRDTGIGIPAELLPQIFEVFARTRHPGRSNEGLGIGLSLVQTLVQMHGGSVEARSDGPGSGSEFVVRLPVIDAADAASDSSKADAPGVRLEPEPLPPVLVVDDNRDAADSLRMLLELAGAPVDVAYDGTSALALLQSRRPAVAFVDIGMPGMDGYELARRVRADSRLARVTLIALTGWGSDDDRRRSKDAGFDHHLVKPVDFETVRTLLRTVDTRSD